MTVAVVLVSAGKGARLGASVPKAVVSVAGKTLLELSLMHISEFKPDQLIVVAPDGPDGGVRTTNRPNSS